MVGPILLLVACHSSLNSGTGGGGDTGDSAEPTETGETADPDTGPDPATLDQDDDGFTPNDGDCDDERAHVYPGAPDYCDGLDADCDGEPIPDGSCSEVWNPSLMWTWSFESFGEVVGYAEQDAGDLDGDEREDLLVHMDFGGEDGRGVISSLHVDSWPARLEWAESGWTDNYPEWVMEGSVASGDTTGDGLADVWLTTYQGYGYEGGAFLFPGREGGVDTTLQSVDDAAGAMWLGGGGVWLGGTYASPGAGDVTGDGRPELVVRTVDTGGVYRWSWIVDPVPDGSRHTFGELPGVVLDTGEVGYAFGAIVGDLDGDGLDEGAINIVPTVKLELAYLNGTDCADGAHLLDVGSFAFFRERGSDEFAHVPSVDPGRPGDVDGDGLVDSLLTTYDPVDGVCAMLLSGGVPSGNVEALAVVRACSSTGEGNVEPTDWVDDIDDDGAREVVVNGITVVPSSLLRGGGVIVPADVGLRIAEGGPRLATTADLTGDGYAEWVFSDVWENEVGASIVRSIIIEGFPIPWDDPTKW